jgi:3-phosphoshikimate 1-carboxyvinyltransferase
MQDSREIIPHVHPVDADIRVPGSKSYTNRALIIAALANGKTRLTGALKSDDTLHMSKCLNELGIVVEDEGGDEFIIQGSNGHIPATDGNLFVGNSGTTARFLTAFVSLGCGNFRIDGVPRMRQRPIQDLLDGLSELGVDATSEMSNGCPPLSIVADGIQGGPTSLSGNQSSQYLTALLLVSPYATQNVDIRINGTLVSTPYIDMTLQIMRKFGVEVVNQDYKRFIIEAGQHYRSQDYRIEPDASNASYFFGAAALTGGRVKILGIPPTSAQGDMGFVKILEQMGCQVQESCHDVEVMGSNKLNGLDTDMNNMPDVVQTVCAIAPFASSPVSIRNVGNLRIKETDRIAAMATELRRLGIRVDTRPDGLTIYPGKIKHPSQLETYEDHRMAMSLSLIGLRVPGIQILDPGCVDKSFPSYFDHLESLH